MSFRCITYVCIHSPDKGLRKRLLEKSIDLPSNDVHGVVKHIDLQVIRKANPSLLSCLTTKNAVTNIITLVRRKQ